MSTRVTEKQLAANRRNARKSTGPRTPEGKRRSSRNALKHGLLAAEVVITDGDGAERQQDFDRLLADLCADLRPVGIVERSLVERIAACYWRLRRAQRYEVGAIRNSLDECNRPDDDPDANTAEDIQDHLDRALADLARKHGPQLKIVEACHTKDRAGAIDVWVPQLNYLHRDYDYYQQRQKSGDLPQGLNHADMISIQTGNLDGKIVEQR